MGIEILTEIEVLGGIFSLLYVIISFIIGLKIASKYAVYNQKELLTIGISQIFTTSVYWSSVIAFLTITFFDYEPILAFHIYFHLLPPVGLTLWIYSFSSLVYPMSNHKIVYIFLTICILYDISLLIFLNIDPTASILGRRTGIILNETSLYINSFLLFTLLAIIITMALFIQQTRKSADPKIQWKGRFLLIGLILFTISSVIGIILPDTSFVVILIRILLILGGISSYNGWLLPDRIAKWLIKKRE